MLYSFTKRIFHWFVELFDHKIVPNIPGDTPSTPNFKNPFSNNSVETYSGHRRAWDLANMEKDWLFKSPININIESTPWYKDWSTLLYIAGGIVTIGSLYIGYKVIMDPSILYDWFKSNPKITTTGATPPTDPGIELRDARLPGSSTGPGTAAGAAVDASSASKDFYSGIINTYNKTVYNLNPLHWFSTSKELQDAHNAFMGQQLELNTQNKYFYPFTADNPYDSWLKKLRLRWLGETALESQNRTEFRILALREADEVWNKGKELLSPASSPVPSTAGLRGLGIESWNRTPKLSPLNSPIGLSSPIQNLPTDPSLGADWTNNEKDLTISPRESMRAWRARKDMQYTYSPANSLDEVGDDLVSHNKYEILGEQII